MTRLFGGITNSTTYQRTRTPVTVSAATQPHGASSVDATKPNRRLEATGLPSILVFMSAIGEL
ncbi:MAG: hypothetical protein IPO18_02825 [bacterium]|nr:hypothetical protein [bacterium]